MMPMWNAHASGRVELRFDVKALMHTSIAFLLPWKSQHRAVCMWRGSRKAPRRLVVKGWKACTFVERIQVVQSNWLNG